MLTEAQKDTKLAYLLQENQKLRDALLDLQITSGMITLTGQEGDGDDAQHPAAA